MLYLNKMRRTFAFAKRVFPRISRTEQIALESGTPGLERFAFSGSLSHNHLSSYKPSSLSATDKEMISRIPELVSTVDESNILRQRVTPIDHPFWQKAKDKNFFGLIVPDEYGGKSSRLLGYRASYSIYLP